MWAYIMLIAVLVLLTLVVIASRFDLTERLRRRWESELDSQESREAISQLRGMAGNEARSYILGVTLIAAVKLIWRWRTAPDGSVQKLVWNVAVLATVAIGVWLVIHVIDGRINRAARPLPDYENIDEEHWEISEGTEFDWREN